MGSFTRACHRFFPHAKYLLIEPLKEYLPSLAKVVETIPNASYEMAAASATATRSSSMCMTTSSAHRCIEKAKRGQALTAFR